MEVYNFKCKNCGSNKYEKIDENTFKCPYCGYREEILKPNPEPKQEEPKPEEQEPEIKVVPHTEEKTEQKKQTSNGFHSALIYLLITVFLGLFGVHKFMKGKVLIGFIYLCTCGLFFVGWGIDIIFAALDLVSELGKAVFGDD